MFLLWEIPRGGCHYPLTDEPTHLFCGEPVTEMRFEGEVRPSSYCKAHHKVCYFRAAARTGKAWPA